MLKILYADCLGLSSVILAQFTPEMPVAAPYFDDSRSFKVIDVDISKKLVASACYDKQHVCAYLQSFSR